MQSAGPSCQGRATTRFGAPQAGSAETTGKVPAFLLVVLQLWSWLYLMCLSVFFTGLATVLNRMKLLQQPSPVSSSSLTAVVRCSCRFENRRQQLCLASKSAIIQWWLIKDRRYKLYPAPEHCPCSTGDSLERVWKNTSGLYFDKIILSVMSGNKSCHFKNLIPYSELHCLPA